jgi:hypothetical protein
MTGLQRLFTGIPSLPHVSLFEVDNAQNSQPIQIVISPDDARL